MVADLCIEALSNDSAVVVRHAAMDVLCEHIRSTTTSTEICDDNLDGSKQASSIHTDQIVARIQQAMITTANVDPASKVRAAAVTFIGRQIEMMPVPSPLYEFTSLKCSDVQFLVRASAYELINQMIHRDGVQYCDHSCSSCI